MFDVVSNMSEKKELIHLISHFEEEHPACFVWSRKRPFDTGIGFENYVSYAGAQLMIIFERNKHYIRSLSSCGYNVGP